MKLSGDQLLLSSSGETRSKMGLVLPRTWYHGIYLEMYLGKTCLFGKKLLSNSNSGASIKVSDDN